MRRMTLSILLGIFCLFSINNLRADPNGSPTDRTVDALQQDIKADPNNAELWVHLGFAYRKQENTSQAKDAFQKAVALDSKNVEALMMLALIYEKEKKTDDALRTWKQMGAATSDPERKALAEKHIHHLSQ